MNKPYIDIPVLVEGKYDKIKLDSILDAKIITTDGFGVFKNDEKIRYIKSLAQKNGLIVLTDSDGAGLIIRNFVNSILPKEKIFHIYTPAVPGKEKRKKHPSKEGLLGVEGVEKDLIFNAFSPFFSEKKTDGKQISKTDLYSDGLCGGQNSRQKRVMLQQKLGLPLNLSSNALLDALNLLYSYDEYKSFLNGQ